MKKNALPMKIKFPADATKILPMKQKTCRCNKSPADEKKVPADENKKPCRCNKNPADETKSPADDKKSPADENKIPCR